MDNEIENIIQIISGVKFPDNLTVIHRNLHQLFQKNGYQVKSEFSVEIDGSNKHVDFVIKNGNAIIGIEIDRKSPRKRSVLKLNAIKNLTHRIIILRRQCIPDDFTHYYSNGIDAILALAIL